MPHTTAGNVSISILHTVPNHIGLLLLLYSFLCLKTTRNFLRPIIIGLKQNIIMYFYRFIDI